jgi:hypothetical protein
MGLKPAHASMIHGPGPRLGLDLGLALQGAYMKKLLHALSRSLFAQAFLTVITGKLTRHRFRED